MSLVTAERVGAERNVGLVTLNRAPQMNAVDKNTFDELEKHLKALDADKDIKAIIITGSGKAFCGGMDLKWALGNGPSIGGDSSSFEAVQKVTKPVIAAVNGPAFGAGSEILMMCDIAWASEKAIIGQPEINVGLVPGLGGTQRLPRIAGKSLGMELCLTGRPFTAAEAKAAGLVSRVLPHEKLLPEVIKLAETIASKSPLLTRMIKESVNRSWEGPLSEGLLFERRIHQATAYLPDAKEGMAAFIQKRSPKWSKI